MKKIFLILFCLLVVMGLASAQNVTQSPYPLASSAGPNSDYGGMKILATSNFTVMNFEKSLGTTATQGFILNSTKGILYNGTVSGNVVTFSNARLNTSHGGGVYYFAVYAGGAGYNFNFDAGGTFPENNSFFNWTAGLDPNGGADVARPYIIKNVTLILTTTSLVTLNSPTNGFATNAENITFNASYDSSVYGNYNLTNATYYVWYSNGSLFNKTFISLRGITNNSVLNISSFTTGSYLWNVYGCAANASLTQCSFALENFSFTWRPFAIAAKEFNATASETSYQRFVINITTVPSILSVTSHLVYNGTSYLANSSCTLGNCTITRRIDIPLVSPGFNSENKTFFWNITTFDGTTSFTFSTSDSLSGQNVSRIFMQACGGSATALALNFTAYDEQNLTRVNPYSFKGNFDYWLGTGTVYRNTSFDNSSIAERTLCIDPSAQIFKTNALIEYTGTGATNSTYVQRNYYLNNASVTNSPQNISLYLLKALDATSFIQRVQDNSLFRLAGAIIYTQRYYPGENVYRTVQISKTDDNGESIGFYEVEIVDYKHVIYYNGSVILDTPQQKVFAQSTPAALTFTIAEDVPSPWDFFEGNSSITSSLAYNTSNYIVTFSYIDTTGLTTLGTLKVFQLRSNRPDLQICSTSIAISAATLTCNLTNYTGAFVAKAYVGSGTTFNRLINFAIETVSSILDKTGLIMAWFIILTAAMTGIWNVTVGIVSANAAVILVNLIGLAAFSPLFIGGMIGLSIILIILIET